MKLSFLIPMTQELLSEGNKTDHWALKHARNQKRKQYLKTYGQSMNLAIGDVELPCKVMLTRIAPRKIDSDNLVTTGKFFRDYIADLLIPGLAPGQADSDKRIQWEYAQEKGKVREYALRIEIQAQKEEASNK